MSGTLEYVRRDGSTFNHNLFHPRMEIAIVVDPLDKQLKVFETVYDRDGNPLRRVEVNEQ